MNKHYSFSAPGRTEIGGNHTDHQQGCVLAAAVDLKISADVCLNGSDAIWIRSKGYPAFKVDLNDLSAHSEEQNTSIALVRGVAAGFSVMGFPLRGFDAVIDSEVLPGSGLSSSAAFEVLLGTICNTLFAESRLSPLEIAKIGQYAENLYFGKPCGLMDQMASAIGGTVFIDFNNPDSPIMESIDFDLKNAGYALCIIDSGANHADLTDEYAAIPAELEEICSFFGEKVLRRIPQRDFFQALPKLRYRASDRALLRAIHIYQENERVLRQVEALKRGQINTFLQLVKESGRSSWMYLQNITPAGATAKQDLAIALALCDTLLRDKGAWRVHGGGFAGTVQAFVPLDLLDAFQSGIENVLGKNACRVLDLCPQGAIQEKNHKEKI